MRKKQNALAHAHLEPRGRTLLENAAAEAEEGGGAPAGGGGGAAGRLDQLGTLDQAARQVRDYLSTVFDLDSYDGDVTIVPEVAGIVDTIRTLRKLDADLEVMYVKKDEVRDAVMRAMMDQGFSYADIAGAIGVSKGRVSQLAHS